MSQPSRPDDALLHTAEERVARLGGRLEREGEQLRLFGFGPDLGLDYAWIREASEAPLSVPLDSLLDACSGPSEGWPPLLDRMLDEWIRRHREELRRDISTMLQTWPLAAPSLEEVEGVQLSEGRPLEDSRQQHEAAARSTRLAFLQLREMPELVVARDEMLPALGLSAEALAVFGRAYRVAAEPGSGLQELAATRVAAVRWALEALEDTGDDPDLLAEAAGRWLLPLAHMVDPTVLDELLG